MSNHITLLITLCPESSPPLPALRLLPLLDGPGACEDSGVPLSWSTSGRCTRSLTKLRQQVSLIRFVWGVLFHLPCPETDNRRCNGLNVKVGNICPDAKSWGQVRMEKVEGGEAGQRKLPPLSTQLPLLFKTLTGQTVRGQFFLSSPQYQTCNLPSLLWTI